MTNSSTYVAGRGAEASMFAAAPQRGGSREEGSVLGGFGAGGLLGGILGGDDE